MTEQLRVEMMSRKAILWRCLHGGSLTADSIEKKNDEEAIPRLEFRTRNVSLLTNLIDVYGSCAVVVRAGNRFVGHLRFYPKTICEVTESGPGMCLQQEFPYGPAQDFGRRKFPPLARIEDKTLRVHCLMLTPAEPGGESYRRKGIGTRMARTLVEWASENGWRAIEATAYEGLPIVFDITGQAGRSFWEKIGFRLIRTDREPALEEESDFVLRMREEARARSLDPAMIKNRYIMRLDLE